jgi:uncharacterized protein YukE
MRSSLIEPAGPARPLYHPDRVAHAQASPFAPARALRQPAATTSGPSAGVASHDGMSVHRLRDQYTAHCLRNAVLAYHAQQARLQERAIAVNRALRDEQAALQARADAANDLGTIQGLMPQQIHRHAVGVPPIVAPPFTAAAGVGQASVAPVADIAKTRSATENALPPAAARREPNAHGTAAGLMAIPPEADNSLTQ